MKLADELNESVKDHIKKNYGCEDADFEKTDPDHCVKSIAKTEKGFVGFSHRASCEFQLGNMLFTQDFGKDMEEEDLEKMKFIDRGSVKIKTMDQAKEAASNFAEYVS